MTASGAVIEAPPMSGNSSTNGSRIDPPCVVEPLCVDSDKTVQAGLDIKANVTAAKRAFLSLRIGILMSGFESQFTAEEAEETMKADDE